MKIIFNFHKTLEILSKVKIPYLTLLIAFISSFNLWFLCIYFFLPNFLTTHGFTITLLTTYGLTISWCLITSICVPKNFINYMLETNPESLNEINNKESKYILTLYVFSEIILLHSFFIYLEYLFRFPFYVFISITFWFAVVQFLWVDYSVKKAYEKYLTSTKQ